MQTIRRTLTAQVVMLFALLFTSRGAGQTPSYTILHSFKGGTDGIWPEGGVILGEDGSLYGTTFRGGAGNTSECNVNAVNHCGTVFKLTPVAGGAWVNSVIFDFDGPDGGQPVSSLVFGNNGALYGTTEVGGSGDACGGTGNPGGGAVFQLLPPATAGGTWTENVLYSFPCGLEGPKDQWPAYSSARMECYLAPPISALGGAETLAKYTVDRCSNCRPQQRRATPGRSQSC